MFRYRKKYEVAVKPYGKDMGGKDEEIKLVDTFGVGATTHEGFGSR